MEEGILKSRAGKHDAGGANTTVSSTMLATLSRTGIDKTRDVPALRRANITVRNDILDFRVLVKKISAASSDILYVEWSRKPSKMSGEKKERENEDHAVTKL